jgi:hypothetical protein
MFGAFIEGIMPHIERNGDPIRLWHEQAQNSQRNGRGIGVRELERNAD